MNAIKVGSNLQLAITRQKSVQKKEMKSVAFVAVFLVIQRGQ